MYHYNDTMRLGLGLFKKKGTIFLEGKCRRKENYKRDYNNDIRQNDIRQGSKYLPIISRHRLELNHKFDWNNVKILDIENQHTLKD